MQRFQILVGQISQKMHAKMATLYGFQHFAVFFQKNRIGMLPLDQDPTARDARIGDDPQNGGAVVAGDGGGRSRAHLGLL